MKVFIASDMRVAIINGRYYLAAQHYYIIKRYKNIFDNIVLCCRIMDENNIGDMLDATDLLYNVVTLYNLSDVFKAENKKAIENELSFCNLFIGRFHSITAYRTSKLALKKNIPIFAEVMGDAWDAYWNHGLAGKLVAPYMFFKTRQTIRHADYALYVTNEFLQNRYPCENESVGVSNVLIESIDDGVLQKRLQKIARTDHQDITLMTTAAIDVKYKGQEFVIKAIPLLNKAGIRVRYLLVGGGDDSYLKNVAKACGADDQVEFVGRRPLTEVFELLDEADIYIQPSLQEGLPRSVIEAMSRACPVIGAKTAGIPELIAAECVVKRKSARSIADTIKRIVNAEKMAELAKQNFENAKAYQDSVLSERRNKYYRKILDAIDKYE